jgi:hypothetical protein
MVKKFKNLNIEAQCSSNANSQWPIANGHDPAEVPQIQNRAWNFHTDDKKSYFTFSAAR